MKLWLRIIFNLFSRIFWFFGKATRKPLEWFLYWLHIRSWSKTFLHRFVHMQIDNSWTLPWINIQLPCILQDLLSHELIYFFLVNIGVIDGYKESILFFFEIVMWPEAIIESEVMLFFIFTSDLMYNSGIIFHFDTSCTTEKFLSLVKRTNSDGYFDTHIW